MATKDQVLTLHNLKNVNTVLSMLYDADGNYRAGFKPEEFYNTILLDTLKYGDENYVHLKYAENLPIKRGFKTAKFRRWAGMTPTLRPLKEGVPPAPDKHAYEVLEIGNVWSFGRWSEYTDQVDMSVVSEVIAERSVQYGELANQIKELYARKVWLSSPNEYFANFKQGFNELGFGDTIGLDDLRFLVSRMKRMMVKPISGKFNYICSPEFINGLIDDPRVIQYMTIENTTGKLFTNGEPFDLFELSFIPTMLDEFAYPDTEYPGVYELADGKEVIRLYAIGAPITDDETPVYYISAHQDLVVGANNKTAKYNTGQTYLPDGTAVDDGWEKWEIPNSYNVGSPIGGGNPTKDAILLQKSIRTLDPETKKYKYGPVEAAADDKTAAQTLLANGAFMQLPVHRGILFGDEALVKLSVDGVSDAPKIIVKPLGSSGVADPLDQRQSIGFRVDGFGLAIKRPEAICVTYSIPENAEFAALTASAIHGDYTLLTNYGLGVDSTVDGKTNSITDGEQDMHVGGVNNTADVFAKLVEGKYSEGELVKYKDEYYVFLKGTNVTDVNDSVVAELVNDKKLKKVIITHKVPKLDEANKNNSNVK